MSDETEPPGEPRAPSAAPRPPCLCMGLGTELTQLIAKLSGNDDGWQQVKSAWVGVLEGEAEAEAELARERARLEASRAALEASTKTRRKMEAELLDLEARRSRYKGQLMEVKTNKEYTAMLHEIEGVEREIRAREDRILEEMENGEGLVAEVKREEAASQSAEQQARTQLRALDEEAGLLDAQVQRLAAEREAVAATLP